MSTHMHGRLTAGIDNREIIVSSKTFFCHFLNDNDLVVALYIHVPVLSCEKVPCKRVHSFNILPGTIDP